MEAQTQTPTAGTGVRHESGLKAHPKFDSLELARMYFSVYSKLRTADSILWRLDFHDLIKRNEEKFAAEVNALYLKAHPRARSVPKLNTAKMIAFEAAEPRFAQLRKAWSDRTMRQIVAASLAKKRCLTLWVAYAHELTVSDFLTRCPVKELGKVHESHLSNYRSQGWGAQKYARADAQAVADALTAFGFTAEVREEEGASWNRGYYVYANCDAFGMAVAQMNYDVRQSFKRDAVSLRVMGFASEDL